MNTHIRRFWTVVIIILSLSIGIGTGIEWDRQASVAQAQSNSATNIGPDMQLITEAWNTIQRVYVDRSAEQTQPLTYGAISGMVNALGDTGHSTFLSPEMVKAEHNYTQGQFEGIGAQVETKDGHVVIVAPFDGSPAQKAGLHAGDVILKVDGKDVSDLPLDQVVGRILGPAGSSVTLTILTPKTGATAVITIERARITLQNVTWLPLPGTTVAHLRIAGFSQGVTKELIQALGDIKQQGLTGVILDLRNNPGGLLDEAVGTTSQFLQTGDVLLEKNAQDQVIHTAVRPGGIATDVPIIVLVNNGSASASEIVAGALQDAHRASLVGETTFGTGTVLNEFPLQDGSALMLAVEEWLTPNGRVIWHKGITPDLVVSLSTGVNPLTPVAERDMTSEQLAASGDTQLLQALGMLSQSAFENHPNGYSTTNQPAIRTILENAILSSLAIEPDRLIHFAFV